MQIDVETNIYFVRHAQPDFSVKNDRQRPLTQKGMRDRELATKALQNIKIKKVYSSPYKRAFDTVKHLADINNLEIHVVEDFRERKANDEGVADFKSFSRKQWEDFNFKLKSGECLKEVQQRNITALFKVLKNNLGSNVVVGTHGTALSTIINYFDHDFGYEDFWGIIDKMPYVICIKFKNEEFVRMKELELVSGA